MNYIEMTRPTVNETQHTHYLSILGFCFIC